MTMLDPARLTALVDAARAVRECSYSPYSGFAVGAALLDEEGRVHLGTNVENAAYPCGVCAEAAAISAMVAAGGRRIQAIAIVGPAGPPCMPCGGCRQRLREFAADDALVLVCGPEGRPTRFSLGTLLPQSFGPGHLSGG